MCSFNSARGVVKPTTKPAPGQRCSITCCGVPVSVVRLLASRKSLLSVMAAGTPAATDLNTGVLTLLAGSGSPPFQEHQRQPGRCSFFALSTRPILLVVLTSYGKEETAPAAIQKPSQRSQMRVSRNLEMANMKRSNDRFEMSQSYKNLPLSRTTSSISILLLQECTPDDRRAAISGLSIYADWQRMQEK